VSLGKDAVALFRDGSLLILAVLLVVFPRKFNRILVDAGFEEGSVVGFRWKSKLVARGCSRRPRGCSILNSRAPNGRHGS
jgi:hypothetical protein